MPYDNKNKSKKYTNKEIGSGLGLLSLVIGFAGWLIGSQSDDDDKSS